MALLKESPWLKSIKLACTDYYCRKAFRGDERTRAWICAEELHKVFDIPPGCWIKLSVHDSPGVDRESFSFVDDGLAGGVTIRHGGQVFYVACPVHRILRRLARAGLSRAYLEVEIGEVVS